MLLKMSNKNVLSQNYDILSPQGIRSFFPDKLKNISITVLDSIDSTNLLAKKLVLQNLPHRSIITANKQISGLGRYGKSFFSPAETGIYMSIILREKKKFDDILLITLYTAVAVSQSIEALTGKKPSIKWVNDILVDGKKVCGILTESVGGSENNVPSAVIAGIGLNIKTEKEQFPEELRDTAGSLFPCNITRNEFIAKIAEQLFGLIDNFSGKEIIVEYKNRLISKDKTALSDENGQVCYQTADYLDKLNC